jgi:2-oxoglutarate/2-oxoacid ferredoxin oxidoreductase subunit beta
MAHKGAAFLDIISPCVAFNNHAGSTKSYDYVREHNDAVNRLDFIASRAPITADLLPGETQDLRMHDGRMIRLRKLNEDYDPTDRVAAIGFLESRRAAGEVVTGLLYLDEESVDLHDALQTVPVPLNALMDAELVPGNEALAGVNASLR